ncbi:DUF4221 family protein [Roseivirga echinicomitans]|uniref:DUF4221 family protein n=1 Tax=Roseivirga echinicomitans TaxID=296218 RepID=UPI00083920DD|nr:DUF4221 family protein [Roseivirga echinicomitans]
MRKIIKPALITLLFLWCISGLAQKTQVGVIGELNLALDNETAPPNSMGSSFQYCEDRKAIAYFNRLTKAIKYFDAKTGKGVGQTQFALQGPDDIGPDPFYFHYHNKDSIFILSRGTNFRMFLMNSEGKKLNTFHYSSDDYSKIRYPSASTLFGALVVRPPFAYIGLEISDQGSQNTMAPIIKLNMDTDTFNYLADPLPYQNIDLQTTVWNNFYYFYNSRIAENTKNGDLIVSFPLDHNVYRIRSEGIEKLDGKSKAIGDFHFLKRKRQVAYDPNNIDVRSIGSSSAWYYGVIYNPYLDQYYRIGMVEQGRDTYKRRLEGEEVYDPVQYSVTIYDSKFHKIADGIIHGREVLFARGIFVTPDGLCGPQHSLKGEDIMGISIIGLKK